MTKAEHIYQKLAAVFGGLGGLRADDRLRATADGKTDVFLNVQCVISEGTYLVCLHYLEKRDGKLWAHTEMQIMLFALSGTASPVSWRSAAEGVRERVLSQPDRVSEHEGVLVRWVDDLEAAGYAYDCRVPFLGEL